MKIMFESIAKTNTTHTSGTCLGVPISFESIAKTNTTHTQLSRDFENCNGLRVLLKQIQHTLLFLEIINV